MEKRAGKILTSHEETMETHIPSREEALAILKEYNSIRALINHAKAVEAAMRYMALKTGHENDVEKWGVINSKYILIIT